MSTGVIDWVSILNLALTAVALVFLPMFRNKFDAQDRERREMRDEINAQLRQQERKVEDLGQRVLGQTATRDDLNAMKSDINDTINRMRAALSVEMNAHHERLMRLENRAFGFTREGD